MKKSKKTFFKGSSKGKKAFPGSFSGAGQKKQTTAMGKKKQPKFATKQSKPEQKKPQSVGTPKQKRQDYLRPRQPQPHYQMGKLGVGVVSSPKQRDDMKMMMRIRRATGG